MKFTVVLTAEAYVSTEIEVEANDPNGAEKEAMRIAFDESPVWKIRQLQAINVLQIRSK